MTTQNYFRFCPRCRHRLSWRVENRGEPQRQKCIRCGFTFYNNPVCATEALIIRSGKILLVRRAKEPRRGYWDFPGGFIEGRELASKSVIREISEELGARFRPNKLIGVYSDIYQWQGRLIPVVILSYSGKLIGSIKPNHEIGQVKWWPVKKLPTTFAFPHMRQCFKDLLKNKTSI